MVWGWSYRADVAIVFDPARRPAMPRTRSVRHPEDRTIPRRAVLPQPSPLKLPNGWYDPDSAAFDDRAPTDIDELFRTTKPAEPGAALRPVAS
jgi:hypothetical protein